MQQSTSQVVLYRCPRLIHAAKHESSCPVSETRPPTSDAPKFHIVRSHYQASVWNQAHSPYPDLPPVTEMGWMHLDGRLMPRLLYLPPIPKPSREITSCGCIKGCLIQRCNCRKIRREFIEACNCSKFGDNCRNSHDNQT